MNSIFRISESYKYCPDNVDFYNNKWNRTIDTNIVVIQCSDNYAGILRIVYIRARGLWCLPPLSTIFQLYRDFVLLVEETRVHGENRRPVASHSQTLSHNVASSTPCDERDSNSQLKW